ncbi:hypothetical protein FB004_10339 [Sinorhizobium medicae]|nr:hypothetical protein FB004_10339 [Sinorhizobium medicae]
MRYRAKRHRTARYYVGFGSFDGPRRSLSDPTLSVLIQIESKSWNTTLKAEGDDMFRGEAVENQ